MKNIFAILFFLFASNLFAQDSSEVKRIDSFIEANEKTYHRDNIKIVWGKEEAAMCMPAWAEEILEYKFLDAHKIFKVQFVALYYTDTTISTTYYFKNDKLIKLIYRNDSTSNFISYYSNSFFIKSNTVITKKSQRANLKLTKSLLKGIRKNNFMVNDFFKYGIIRRE